MPLTNRFLRLSRPRVSRAPCAGLTRREALVPIALLPLAVAACGGGDDDLKPADDAPPPNGHWTMDDLHYVGAAGMPQEVTVEIEGHRTLTAVMGDHDDVSHGAYSGSVITVFLSREAPGTYPLAPTSLTFASAAPGTKLAYVEVMVGSNVTTGSSVYAPEGGQLVVTRGGADGRFRFSSDGPLKVVKVAEALGGVRSAPASMTLQLHDAH